MSSRSQSRGRSRTRDRSSGPANRSQSPVQPRSTSRRRSGSDPRRARTPTGSRSRSRSPITRDARNGHNGPNRMRNTTRSRSPDRDDRPSYRERSYSRSPSRERIQSSKIVVEKLTKNVTEAHLQEIFGSYGRIESIDMPMNRQFMTNRGTAYIVYDHPSGSESAIANMHEAQLDGAVITVSIVLPRRAFSRSPPPAKSWRGHPNRGGPPARGAPSSGRYRSPPLRRGGYGAGRRGDYEGDDRNGGHQQSRSPTPPRRRRRSYSYSRSPSRTPPRRRGPPVRSPPRRRRRSPSYSSYSSYSRSRSRTRSRSRSRSRR